MSETYAVPGVYVTESNALALSIQSGETAVPVFVGFFNAIHPAKAGAPLACVRIESWLDFTQQFGPSDRITVDLKQGHLHSTSYMGSYSVRLYFENGGGPCYVLSLDRDRTEKGDSRQAVMSQIGPAIEQCPDITLLCWCEHIDKVNTDVKQDKKIDTAVYQELGKLLGASATSGGNRGMFLLADAGVTGDPEKPGDWTISASLSVADTTQVAMYFPSLVTRYVADLARYVDHAVVVTGFTSDQLDQLTKVGVALRDDQQSTTLDALKEKAKVTEVGTIITAANKLLDADHLLKLSQDAEPVVLRASVAMAGVYARVDRERGVWKAPANVGLVGVKDLAVMGLHEIKKDHTEQFVRPIRVDESLNAKLVDAKINAIRTFRGQGAMVWGARTMVDPHQTNWLYVPVRRLFNTVERDARAALRTVVFEPNSAVTWEAVRGALDHYLNALWRQGALQGDTPTQAYFVRVGLGTTMTQEDITAGKMIVRMGLAAVRPAEFIVLELTQDVATA
ncbi:phage tail sheath family protein (plasmid) [Burkholderia sp. MS455]|uniref:phage tail sheath family protein n=1 Tax=Burkholderia sp. MS455 TaxID=2811788 RepID=UPI00195A6D0B|nr:phage tail sheath family protein [Burkholderia sp. MS455]QRR11836.1 phage tail sheath family protein [Burkholderia sp. MS455]